MDGSFFAAFDLVKKTPSELTEPWWSHSGVYQLKATLTFRLLAEVVGLNEFKAISEELLHWCLRRHEGLYFQSDVEMTMSCAHAHCCFLEGLLPDVSLNANSSEALRLGVRKVESLFREVGHQFQRCDVLAQLVRLRLLADCLGVLELYYQQACKEVAELEEFQWQSSDPKIDGSFSFARQNGQLMLGGHTVATLIALQVLWMWEQFASVDLCQSWKNLI